MYWALQYKQSQISFVVNIIFHLIKLSMLKVKPLFTAFPTYDVNDTSFPIWRLVANGVKGESVRAILSQKKRHKNKN